MGMPKITDKDVERIVAILKAWPGNRKLTWEELRKRIAQTRRNRPVWSRQALEKNDDIKTGFHDRKQALRGASTTPNDRKSKGWYVVELHKAKIKIKQLEAQLDSAQIRNADLAIQVSLTPGGSSTLAPVIPLRTEQFRPDGAA